MRKGLPKLSALQAFEASARLGSFSKAAEELALTHSAVFRQVDGLEEQLGVRLFNRVRRRIALTDQGRAYAARVRHHLDQLQKDTFSLMNRSGVGRNLHIAVLPTLASSWLIPRLADFARFNPDIDVSLSVKVAPFQFKDFPADGAIYHAEHPWANADSTLLFTENELVPVCSSQLLARHKGSDLLQKLPHLHMMTRSESWLSWYKHHDLATSPEILAGPRYELFSMLLAAVDAGLGMALVPQFIANEGLRSGRLVQVLDKVLPVKEAYYFGTPELVQDDTAIKCFKDWLMTQV